jgi:hypothetical protein
MNKTFLLGLAVLTCSTASFATTLTMDSAIFSIPDRQVVEVQVSMVDAKNNYYQYTIPNGTPSFTVPAPITPYNVQYHEVYMTPNGKRTWTTGCIDNSGGYNHEGYLFEPTWNYNVHFTQPDGDINKNPDCYVYHS